MLDQQFLVKTEPIALAQNQVCIGYWRITVLTSRLFRMEFSKKKTYCDEATQTVWFRNLPKVPFHVEGRMIVTEDVSLSVGDSLENSYVILDGKRLKINNDGNLSGTCRTLDFCDGGTIDATKEPLKLNPGVLSKNGVAVLDDSRSLILGKDGMVHARRFKETDVYVFAYGNAYRDAIKDLYRICGKTPMIPRFALGNWWSRYHAYTDREYLHLLDRLQERDLPFTVATIDMDWHWSTTVDEKKKITESGKKDTQHGCSSKFDSIGWTGYSWNTDLFPDYKAFLKEIKKRNLKITLNLHPALGVRYFEDQYPKMAEAMGVDPKTEAVIPFDFTSENFINSYFRILHKPYEHDGVDFWWIDWQRGKKLKIPELDPLWALNHYHTLDNAAEHQPLILSRYCGVGSHRYPIGFSGDTFATWETLAYLPYFTATASNVGYTWWSHDIGGHMFGIKDNELYLRFIQFGVFSPINRLHCSDSPMTNKEPFVYPNGRGRVAEDFLRLRHRMIPFLYSASYQTSVNGRALMEPMYYEYPEESDAYRCRNQYLFGGQLLVAPVIKHSDSKGMTATKVWLPHGNWTDIFTGDEYRGGKWIEAVRWIESIPVFAKEGGFFILDGREHSNLTDLPDRLTICSYFGNGEFDLYEDDGGKRSAHTTFTSVCKTETTQRKHTVTIVTAGDKLVVPEKRILKMEFRNFHTGSVIVSEDGKPIPFQSDDNGFIKATFEISFGKCYTVTATENEVNERKAATDRMIQNLLMFENTFEKRDRLCETLLSTDVTKWRHIIQMSGFLTENEKKRLFESSEIP